MARHMYKMGMQDIRNDDMSVRREREDTRRIVVQR